MWNWRRKEMCLHQSGLIKCIERLDRNRSIKSESYVFNLRRCADYVYWAIRECVQCSFSCNENVVNGQNPINRLRRKRCSHQMPADRISHHHLSTLIRNQHFFSGKRRHVLIVCMYLWANVALYLASESAYFVDTMPWIYACGMRYEEVSMIVMDK